MKTTHFFLALSSRDRKVALYENFVGKWLGSRQIRCNWATKGAGTSDEKQNSDAKSVVELTNGSSGEYVGGKIINIKKLCETTSHS